jgi:hypothetical protein
MKHEYSDAVTEIVNQSRVVMENRDVPQESSSVSIVTQAFV